MTQGVKCRLVRVMRFLGVMLLMLSPVVRGDVTQQAAGVLDIEERQWLDERDNTIILGSDMHYAPIEFFDSTGRHTGIVADYLTIIEDNLGIRFTVVCHDTWGQLIESARNRQVDAVATMQPTPERSEYMLFTEAYLEVPNVILTRADSEESLDLENLRGMTVAVIDGYAVQEYLRTTHPDLDLLPVSSEVHGLRDLSLGVVDVMVINLATAAYHIHREGISNLRVAGSAGPPNSLAIASRNDEPIINRILQKGLATISSEQRDSVYRQWISLESESIAPSYFWERTGIGLALAAVIFTAILLWNRSLRMKVEKRTAELSDQLTERVKAEEALVVSETKYRNLVESMNEGFGILDTNARILYVNPKLAEMLGYDAEEMLGNDIHRYFDRDNRAVLAEQLSLRSEGCNEPYEVIWRRKDGSGITTIISPRALYDDFGKFKGSCAVITDIGWRKRTEEALRESQQKLSVHFRNTPLGVIEWNLDFEVTDWNPAAQRIFGFSKAEALGQKAFGLVFSESDEPHIARVWNELLLRRGGERSFNESITKSGEKISCEWYNTALVDANGIVIGVASLVEDVTERRKAEIALLESKARIESIFKAAPTGIGLVCDRVLMDVNEKICEMVGYSREELIGRSAQMLYPSVEDFEKVGRDKYDQIREMGTGTVETHWKRKDGTVIDVLLSSTPVDLSDLQKGVTFTALDITDRKLVAAERERLIAELEEKSAEMEQLTYAVSHGLKSPLVTIAGYLDIIRQDAAEGNGQRLQEDLDRIGGAAGRMREMLDGLLHMSRIGRVPGKVEAVSLSELARQASELVAGSSVRGGVKIEIVDDMPVVRGDRSQLLELMQNLMENSVKYMGDQKSPRIEVGAKRGGDETVFYIRDNGVGIAPDRHSSIFNMFEQLDPSAEGTGIGLAVVKRIIEAHRGRIWVESDGPGSGATFCFVLSCDGPGKEDRQ